MTPALTITVADADVDYLGLQIHACNERFAGSIYVYTDLDKLTDFAARIAGFPKDSRDRRTYEFGSREPSVAGGYCSLRFHCVDRAGHVAVDVVIEDDDEWYAPASAQLSFQTEAAAIDRFIGRLRELEREL